MTPPNLHQVCLQKKFNAKALIEDGALTEQQYVELDLALKGILMEHFKSTESDAEGILHSAFLGNMAVINSYTADIAATKMFTAEQALSEIKKQIPVFKDKIFFISPTIEALKIP